MKALLIGISLLIMVSCTSWTNDDECMTDACITERTGDINPADPADDAYQYTEEERND